MTRMQTRFDCFAPTMDWLNPLGSWDAAARWNTSPQPASSNSQSKKK